MVKRRGPRRHRWHTARGHAAPPDGLPAEAGVILGDDCEREPLALARDLRSPLGGQGGGERRHGRRPVFAWDGRGRGGVARRAPRTKAYTLDDANGT
jgi:hypothetical protein